MMQLVPDRVVHDADQRYPGDSFNRNYYCLSKWCQMNSEQATLKTLKQVLKENDRTDLAQDIDKIDANVEHGYETAPP